MSAPPADSVRVTLAVPEEVPAGTPVTMTLRAANDGDRPMDLYLTGRPVAFDLTVRDAQERTVWRRLEGAVIPMVLRLITLEPGDSLVFTHDWDQRTSEGDPVPPGPYTVTGEILSEEGTLASPPRPFQVVPP